MTTSPHYNALLAIAYIALLVTGVFMGSNLLEGVVDETIFLPMGFIATFVLSAALMAYLFFYQPLILFLEGRREEALRFFFRTVGTFAAATAVVIIIALVVGSLGVTSLK